MAIEKRRRRYYAVLDIPKDLRPRYGKKRHIKSLETDSLSVAKRREAVLLSAWKAEFAELRAESADDATYFGRQLQGARAGTERDQMLRLIEIAAETMARPAHVDGSVKEEAKHSRLPNGAQASTEKFRAQAGKRTVKSAAKQTAEKK